MRAMLRPLQDGGRSPEACRPIPIANSIGDGIELTLLLMGFFVKQRALLLAGAVEAIPARGSTPSPA